MKKIILIFMIAIFAFVNQVKAEENKKEKAPAAVIGVVNILKIQSQAKVYQSIRKQLSEYKKEYKKDSSKKEKEIKKLNDEIMKQKSLISPEEFKKRVEELKTKFNKDRAEVTKKIEGLDKSFISVMKKVKIEALAPAIDKVAKDRGINIVLNNAEIIFYDPKMDMTEDVLNILNKKMPTVEFPKPQDSNK